MARGVVAKVRIATRNRILNAAILRFSRQSYESTGLRDIAADVGVDVSYVHRCFGSKEQLFAEALDATLAPAELFTDVGSNLSDRLARQIFVRDKARGRNTVGPLDIIIRSLTNPDASRVLREAIRKDFIHPLAEKAGQKDDTRAAIVAALLAGIGILRNVLRIDPLLEAEGGELEQVIARTIAAILTDEPLIPKNMTPMAFSNKAAAGSHKENTSIEKH